MAIRTLCRTLRLWAPNVDRRCGSIVANPIIYRLVPSPSRLEIRQWRLSRWLISLVPRSLSDHPREVGAGPGMKRERLKSSFCSELADRSYSYSRNWTGTSLKPRLIWGVPHFKCKQNSRLYGYSPQ